MISLYYFAALNGYLVTGTGNKVEDFGVGFYTKYGDGGVDISPIADLYKSEVWEMARELGIDQRIIDAKPTDGLWDDGRVDEDQLNGMGYKELEECMKLVEAQDVYDVLEEDEIDEKTGQDLIDANPDDYLIAGLDPYRGAPGPVGVATDYPLFAANGGAMGDVFPRRTGGIMPDEGIPNKDSVKAMVMPGEFILTTDAVRGAGGGDLNRGINNMYSVMRNLESVGRRAS
jgi:hypothetical protein